MAIGFYNYGQTTKQSVVETSIEEVKVFAQGAQIKRSGSLSVPSGRSTLLIRSLSPYLDANSIQVNGKGSFTILSVNHQLDYLTEQAKSEKVDSLQKVLDKLNKELNTEAARVRVYDARKKMLEENQKIGGTNTGISYELLNRMVDYYANELMEIEKGKIETTIKIDELKKEVTRIQNQINQINNGNELPTSVIMVNVDARTTARGEINLSYFTQNAGWYPQYDIRAKDISSPIQLEYKAAVYQNTREDWKQVKLILSNGNPNKSGVAPELVTWYLNFIQPYPRPAQMMKSSSAPMRVAEESMAVMERAPELEADYNVPPPPRASITQNQTTIEIEVKEKYSIESNGDQLTVSLQQYEIPTVYKYFTVPKLDNEAFLLAKIINWEQYNILPGETNLFLEGTYVGKSFLDTYAVTDTLEVSLGRDPGIVIERKKIDIYSKTNFIGSNKIETRGFRISIRNPKSTPISITVHDQIPVSTRDEITVTPQEISGGNLNRTTGEISWDLTIPAGSTRELEMRYEVKYPKKERIILE